MRELRNQGGRVLDRVMAGERVTITRDGRPVARLEPAARGRLSAQALIAQFGGLPDVDAQRLRDDVDAFLDQQL